VEKIYFIADLHFGHKNILTLCNRRFKSIEEHDDFIISSINSVVRSCDRLYILGDLGHKDDLLSLRDKLVRLNGNKHIILGNHDNLSHLVQLKREKIISDVKESKFVQVGKQDIFLSHFPHREWGKYYRGAWHLYGHCHNTLEDFEHSTDVGVDAKGYIPWSFEQIEEYFSNTKVKTRKTVLDDKVNEFFPDLSAQYFVGFCTGNEEIRNKIIEVLIRDGKSIGLTNK
jgi:calcineurin-like phosphoesterase family protein